MLKNKRALSPVIATVILVAVTIVVAVSVAYWMGTISTSYTAHEQIEMPTSYAEYVDNLFDKEILGEVVEASADGVQTSWTLAYSPVVPGSETITPAPDSIDYVTGVITYDVPPAEAVSITADYTQHIGDGWKIHIGLKNTGSADATIDNIFLNDKPIKDYPADSIKLFVETDDPGTTPEGLSDMSVHVAKGTDKDLIIWIQESVEGCASGVTVNLKIHSAQGNLYPVSVKLP